MSTSPLRALVPDPDLIRLARDLLLQPMALSNLDPTDARCIVNYMRFLRCPDGAMLIQEGDQDPNSQMLLVVDGEVSVENAVVSRTEALVVTVLGPGSLIGEMGLLDGAPRASSCVAQSPVLVAALTRDDLRRMMSDEPSVAAKLLASISQRLAERLREAGRQQRVFSQLVRAMQGEIDELNRQLQLVMGGRHQRHGSADSE
jgi:CRP-like cAMP-binding protein